MNKFILTLIVFFSTTIVFGQSKSNLVVIKGILNGDLKGYNKMYLYSRTSNDSATIVDGDYTFSFPFTEVGMKMFQPEYVVGMRQMYQPFGILITGPGTYYVTSDIEKGMAASSEVRGTKGAMLYRQFEMDQRGAYTKINESIAKLYGPQWYLKDEQDAQYPAFKKSQDSLNSLYLMPLLENLIKRNPKEKASAFALVSLGRQIGTLEEKESLLKMLSPELKRDGEGKKFADYIQGLKSSKIGSVVADFSLPDPQDKNVDFSSFKGKYVLLDFWASWCVPCRQSFPHMREVYQKYKGEHFEIYSISIDENKDAWLKAVQEENNPWPQSLDTKNISQSGFAVTAVPTTYLIDPTGKIILKEIGFDPSGNSELEKKIKEISVASDNGNSKIIPAIRMN